ncbi:amino acid permease [Vagococcus carniphilus]|uniref:amino acid permease n=1 Tax=Vagococcus carniphilus TaxID=218144 RepID=UPI003B598F76
MIGYFEEFFSPKIASGFAWFQVFMYLPAINVVVTWVAGVYTLQILGIPYELEFATFVGTVYLMLIFALNFVSMAFGGVFQRLSTIIKLVPFLLISILAILNIQVEPTAPNIMKDSEVSRNSFTWLAALAPMAFSYEGWTVILNISPDIKNREKMFH